jgi:ArsR family transcriptional regulator
MYRDIPQLKAEFFKAMGHPVRIRVLELLAEGEQPVSEMLRIIDIEQSHLSQQLGVLRRAGLVDSHRNGSSVVYSLADDRLIELLRLSREMMLDRLRASQAGLEPATESA